MKQKVDKHDYAVCSWLTTWWRELDGEKVAAIPTPHGYVWCKLYDIRRAPRAFAASFIWHGRHYHLYRERDKVFSRLAAIRAVRKWVREIVREAR